MFDTASAAGMATIKPVADIAALGRAPVGYRLAGRVETETVTAAFTVA